MFQQGREEEDKQDTDHPIDRSYRGVVGGAEGRLPIQTCTHNLINQLLILSIFGDTSGQAGFQVDGF